MNLFQRFFALLLCISLMPVAVVNSQTSVAPCTSWDDSFKLSAQALAASGEVAFSDNDLNAPHTFGFQALANAEVFNLEGPPLVRNELMRDSLEKIGEGVWKTAYGSKNWVIKVQKSYADAIASWWAEKFIYQIRETGRLKYNAARFTALRKGVRFFGWILLTVAPISLFHSRQIWGWHAQTLHKSRLIYEKRLVGTPLVPRHVKIEKMRLRLGRLKFATVEEADERVECTLRERFEELCAHKDSANEINLWFKRWLSFQITLWKKGAFDRDPKASNYGIIGKRLVLLDYDELTDNWDEIDDFFNLAADQRGPQDSDRFPMFMLGGYKKLLAKFMTTWDRKVSRQIVQQNWLRDYPSQPTSFHVRKNSLKALNLNTPGFPDQPLSIFERDS